MPTLTRTRRPTIRWATSTEGLTIYAILSAAKITLADIVDWTQPLGPYWLIAILEQPVGCIMVNPGMPVGRMEFLSVVPTLSTRQHALAVRDLCYAGMAALLAQGSQFVGSYIADQNTSWARIVSRRAFVPMEHGTFMLRRI